MQRRHQKVVEEAPAIGWCPPRSAGAMWDAAVAAARAVGYVGVGTVEFLVEASEFFFLEMNTRLQVEHGVTELVTGLDLVGLQLAVASGRPLPFAQADVGVSGHAVEARLCAERPREGYRPTPGTVTHVRWPEGAGLRIDRAVESGSTVSAAYDSLVAKLMAHGADRDIAVDRLARALRALELDGLETNRDLLTAVLDDEAFRRGDVDVHYLDGRPDLRDAATARRRRAIAMRPRPRWRCLAERRPTEPGPGSGRGLAQRGHGAARGRADRRRGHRARTGHRTGRAPSRCRWGSGGRRSGPAAATGGLVDLEAAGDGLRRRYGVRLGAPRGRRERARGPVDLRPPAPEDDADERGGMAGECRAPLPGAVTKVLVAVGDVVAEGDGLVVLEAMKMEHTLRADGAGTVSRLECAPGPAGRRGRPAGVVGAGMNGRDGPRPASPTAAASSATAPARPARWSRAGRSTSSPGTGWPS